MFPDSIFIAELEPFSLSLFAYVHICERMNERMNRKEDYLVISVL